LNAPWRSGLSWRTSKGTVRSVVSTRLTEVWQGEVIGLDLEAEFVYRPDGPPGGQLWNRSEPQHPALGQAAPAQRSGGQAD
jgi:hypothetical protein